MANDHHAPEPEPWPTLCFCLGSLEHGPISDRQNIKTLVPVRLTASGEVYPRPFTRGDGASKVTTLLVGVGAAGPFDALAVGVRQLHTRQCELIRPRLTWQRQKQKSK